jgi:hypothetical protein
MEAQMNLTQNPLQSEATGKTSVVAKSEATAIIRGVEDPDLQLAQKIYAGLQEDIQRYLIEDYIKPQLEEGDKLISLFNELIDSEDCRNLRYECLIEPVTKIIQNETALAKMRKLDTIGFNSCYIQHFIKKQNTFRLVDDPCTSMCMEFVMRKWH